MSEGGGVIEGMLGEAEEEAHQASQNGLRGESTAAVIATTVAIDAARYDPELSRAASHYLSEQSSLSQASVALLQIQAHHYDEELKLSIEAAKRKRFSDHFRMSLQVFMSVVLGAICLGVLVMVWDAATSKSVVVDSFDTAPALTAQGLTGKVVANRVLDALEELQGATRASNVAWAAKSAWSSDVKIEVPETGISIGEINHFLHERLGHDIHINGDIDLSKEGLATLVVRGEGIPAAQFSGPVEKLDSLATKAAEYIYGRSQANRYATYLIGAGRNDDAIAFIPSALPRATAEDSPDLVNSWGNALAIQGKHKEAEQKYRLALALKPHYWRAWGNLVGMLTYSAGEEAAFRESKAMLRAAADDNASKTGTVEFQNSWIIEHDFPTLIRDYLANIEQNHGIGTAVSPSGPSLADFYANLHDYTEAQKWMAKSDPDDAVTQAEEQLLVAYQAIDAGKPADALPQLQAFWTAWHASKVLQNDTYSDQACMVGLAYGMSGDLAKAEEAFSQNQRWSYCYAVHGDVLEHAGKLAEAEKVWADGLAHAPSMAPVYLHRGISELKRGDYQHAASDLAAASQRAPHWADPFKAWGDVLAGQGNWHGALEKYDAALTYAPHWPALLRAREAAKGKST